MPIFDEIDGKLIPYSSLERMVAALSIELRDANVSETGTKLGAKIKSQDRTITPTINYKSGEWNCSCEDFHYKKLMCKHVCSLLFWAKEKKNDLFMSFITALGRPDADRVSSVMPTGYLSTQSKTIDELTRGGLPLSIVTGFVGDPKIGKTWLAYQVAVSCNLPKEQGGLGKPALYLNTEADFLKPGVQDRFREFFETMRFKQKYTIDFLFPRSAVMLFELFGLGLELKKTEKKVTPSIWDEGDPMESPVAALQRRRGYGLIIVDSMTNIMKKEVPVPPNQNISSRAACINTLWGRFENIVENFGVAMVVTHHITKDPTNDRSFGDPYGGDTIMYNMKHVLHILAPTKDIYDLYGQGARRVMRARWPGLLPTQVPVNLAPNMGFMDVKS